MKQLVFFIPFNVPSSKNGKRAFGGHVVSSQATLNWKKNTEPYWLELTESFKNNIYGLPRPYFIEFTFIRKNNQAFDYINMAQTVLDEMVRYDWIDEDNVYAVKPYFGDVQIDKQNPGVMIRILKTKPQHYDTQDNERISG